MRASYLCNGLKYCLSSQNLAQKLIMTANEGHFAKTIPFYLYFVVLFLSYIHLTLFCHDFACETTDQVEVA